MTINWPVKALGDVCHVIGGGTPPKDKEHYFRGTIPWATVRDMRKDIISETEFQITEEAVGASSTNIIPAHNVVIATRVGLGKVCFVERDTAINQDLRGIVPMRKNELSVHYLFWWLKSIAHLIVQKGTGATVQGVKLPFIKSLEIPLPPFAEQKRIVAILDEAFAGIAAATANAEKNLANARELFDLSLETIFTEEGAGRVQRPFSDICEITSKLVDPREPSFIDLPHLGAGNMVSKTGELIEIKTAREEELKSGKFLFDENMVLYSKIRPYLMKACRPDFSGLCSADVYPLLPKPVLLDRDFLFYLLLTRKFTEFAIAGSDRAGMPKVNRDHLFRYKAWLPDVKEQRLLASKLDEISSEIKRIELIYQRKISALAELKQAILQKAFSGELTGIKTRHCEAA